MPKTNTLEALQADLRKCLAPYTNDPDAVLAEIWPGVVEALHFTEFLGEYNQDATFVELNDEHPGAATDGLAHSQGKWARDGN